MEGLIPKDEFFKIVFSYEAKFQYCQTSDLGSRLDNDLIMSTVLVAVCILIVYGSMGVVPMDCVLILSIFVAQRLALHQNGVKFCQNFIGDMSISLVTS